MIELKKAVSPAQIFENRDNAPRFSILGTGGIAVVLVEVMYDMGFQLSHVFDDDENIKNFHNVDIEPGIKFHDPNGAQFDEPIFICLGDNLLRKRLTANVSAPFIVASHSTGHVSPSAAVGDGTMLFHGTYIQARAVVGRHVIVNTAATIDHDCVIEDFVHIAPQAALCGGVTVGEGSEVGVGATVIPNVRIGKWSKIGAGATVIEDIPDNAVAVGTPARVIKLNGKRLDA